MACEMCGYKGTLVKALVENVEMELCSECARFGKIVRKPRPEVIQKRILQKKQTRHLPKEYETPERVVPDYGEIIQKKRSKLGINQEALAKMLAERTSLVQKLEAGTYKPSLKLARKIQRILKITLVEKPEQIENIPLTKAEGGFTLGDFIKKRS